MPASQQLGYRFGKHRQKNPWRRPLAATRVSYFTFQGASHFLWWSCSPEAACYSLSPREGRTGREPERGRVLKSTDDNPYPIREKSSSSPRPSPPFPMEERETKAWFRHA